MQKGLHRGPERRCLQDLSSLKEGEQPFQPPPNPQMQILLQKGKTEQAKRTSCHGKEQVNLLAAKVKALELYKEMKESDKGIRAEILKTLSELNSLEHNLPVNQER